MNSADILSWGLVISAFLSMVMHIILAIKRPLRRELTIIKSFACGWLSVVFLLNSLGLVINSGGFLGGRPPTIVLLSAITMSAFHAYRNGVKLK